MKTAVSIPDDVFADADRLAAELGRSRSRLYADALREYVARNSPDFVTEAWDRDGPRLSLRETPRLRRRAPSFSARRLRGALGERVGALPAKKPGLILSGIHLVLGR